MAKSAKIQTVIRKKEKAKVRRKGIHSKKKTSHLKTSKNYKKPYNYSIVFKNQKIILFLDQLSNHITDENLNLFLETNIIITFLPVRIMHIM